VLWDVVTTFALYLAGLVVGFFAALLWFELRGRV